MAATITLFQTLQQFYSVLGFDFNPSKKYSMRAKKLIFSFAKAQMFISSAAFFLSKAKSYSPEVGISFYVALTSMSVAICMLNTAWKMDKILKSIAKYEEFIEKR